MSVKHFKARVPEGSTRLYKATLLDEDGNAVVSASISSITLTLWRKGASAVIGGIDGTNVFNANGGTMHATSGLFQYTFTVAQNSLDDPPNDELHYAEFVFTLSSGAVERHIISYWVDDLPDSP